MCGLLGEASVFGAQQYYFQNYVNKFTEGRYLWGSSNSFWKIIYHHEYEVALAERCFK